MSTTVRAHLRPEQLAERWSTNVRTLSNWRSQGKGPAYIKVGGAIRYPLEAVEAYEQARTVAPLGEGA